PGASEVNVPQFMDRFYAEILTEADQENLQAGLKAFMDTAGGSDAAAITAALEKTLKAKPEPGTEPDSATQFAYELRGKAIWSYKTSEYIGEEVLVYLPVPGEYLPCEDLESLTGGKAYTF
ncbi:MAG: gluconate 2-dehydrogenase subunit 3 family protein, partial [Flavobacteriaceae bacterium]